VSTDRADIERAVTWRVVSETTHGHTMHTQLDQVLRFDAERPDAIWLTQPMGGGRVIDLRFKESVGEARRMAAYLGSLDLPAGSRIAIFSKNTAWWFLADLAIWMAGHVSVPIYPNLTSTTIRAILEHAGVKAIFIGKLDGFEAMASGIPSELSRIVMPLGPDTPGKRWEDIVASVEPVRGSPGRNPDDLATLIYTSGSTGAPKGVMHSFRTMCAARTFIDRWKLTSQDRAISYLPLAHVAERCGLETTSFLVGCRVFFAESIETFVEDVRRARPTVFCSVPRLWLKLQAGVHAKIPEHKLARLLRLPLISTMVKRKVLGGIGLDRVRLAICGSAPIPAEVMQWYRELGLPIVEIYAMTENFAVSHAGATATFRPGYVGAPVEGVEQRLSDDGELLVKSPGTMLGYFNAPSATREVLDDGWLHTGDRGVIAPDGQLRITGRVKEIFKTSKGKYVAPAPIENLLLGSGLVDQACVVGVDLPQPYALVVLAPDKRNEAPAALDELDELVTRVNAQLDPHERLDRLVVLSDEWTIENGLLTPTLKVKRSAIEERYASFSAEWSKTRDRVLLAPVASAGC
jgi:long-chain acyl-CoA synthetase